MKCLCDAEVSSSARFCPHCGTLLANELTQSANEAIIVPVTTNLPVNTDLPTYDGSRNEGRQILSEANTLKQEDWLPPLPPKYKATLRSGTAPEMVMWEMFKRIIELSNLLEEAVTSLPEQLDNTQISRARAFLQSHCPSCGDLTPPVENGKMPVCSNCQNI